MFKSYLFLVLTLLPVPAFAAEPFALQDMNAGGAMYTSAEHVNSVFVLEIYQYNCSYCHENVVNIDNIAATFSGNPRVQVLDIGIDRSASYYTQWINRHHPQHPVLNDGQRSLTNQFNIEGTPTTIILDCNMQEVKRISGEMSTSERENLKQIINQELMRVCSLD